jgi:hypothetical protein
MRNSLWRVVLIAVLSAALATPALADRPRLAASGGGLTKVADEAVAGIVVGAVIIVVVVIILVRHNKPQKITGCVNAGTNGMTLTDEKDKRIYTLSGDTAGVKPGDIGGQAEESACL